MRHKIVLFLAFALYAGTLEASSRLTSLYGKPLDSLLFQSFDYAAYLAQVPIFEIDTLAVDAAALDKAHASTDLFFEQLFDMYYKGKSLSSLDKAALTEHIHLGKKLLQQNDMGLQIQGDRLLQQICYVIEANMKAGTFDQDDEEVLAMVKLLEAEKYLITPPTPSDFKKLIRNIKEGDFSQIADRFYSRCVIDCSNGECGSICITCYVVTAGLLGIIVFFVVRLRKKKKAQ